MASTEATPSSPAKTKRFIPLENNPATMTTLLHTLGLSPTLAFHDVYSLTDPDLLAFVPRPAYALLLVFPVSKTYEGFRHGEDAAKKEYDGKGDGEEVVWYKQTIGNACGLIGLLHAVSNGDARNYITKGSDLDTFVHDAVPLGASKRAKLVENSDVLEKAHRDAANMGDTAAPGANDDVDLHYVCFVNSAGKLWEMDGRRKGPLERGSLGEGDDVLSEKALDLGVRPFLKREEEAGEGEVRFSLICLAENLE
ncbi:hypothetical protein B0A48_16350 [Cryoendolithus antarcticus]|uniref:Ubiquitin carboxyl-terminal hydrolase n=1 Tax=Cryoendolithus antarcticus TaxID=1507870 RepID=A0A1V8SDP6_9PEZI|nr:hypothetical protein B0A48_16350 [Cryoendolithus antarcticus]